MYNYTPLSHTDAYEQMRTRIRELEEEKAAADFLIAALLDDVGESRGRERRLLWTVVAFGTVMTIAVVKCSWMAMGR